MDFKKIALAVVLLPGFLWLIGWGTPWMLMTLFLVLGVGLGSWEFSRIAFGPGAWLQTVCGALFSAVVCWLTVWGTHTQLLAALTASFLMTGLVFMFAEKDLAQVLNTAAKVYFGVLLLGLCGGMIVALKELEPQVGGFKLVMALFGLIWFNDAGAYFAGSSLGKHKVAPRLSPNKTIEGNIGGFIATMLLAVAMAMFFEPFTLMDGLILGVIMGVIGPLGDLFESALKRGANVKDSGTLLPGHGGILDRMDSVLFGAPVLYFFVWYRFLG